MTRSAPNARSSSADARLRNSSASMRTMVLSTPCCLAINDVTRFTSSLLVSDTTRSQLSSPASERTLGWVPLPSTVSTSSSAPSWRRRLALMSTTATLWRSWLRRAAT